jgi:hypothetical protein
MVCTKCNSSQIHRIQREGFLRLKLAPFFGLFPWECSTCGEEQLRKGRGRRPRSRVANNPRGEARRQAAGQAR